MANGTYGIKKPAMISAEDVDIFYCYRPTRNTDGANMSAFQQIDSKLLMSTNAVYGNEAEERALPGMYDLRLPMDIFGSKGFYTIYIKPKEIFTTIVDVNVLATYSDVRGVILNSTDIGTFGNGDLVGYRIEYMDLDGISRTGEYRIITSNNRCEPVTQNLSDGTQRGSRYRFNDSSNLIFCTVTPSSSLSFKSNSLPNIGMPGQNIVLVNTKFNPVMLEIEMVDRDIDNISTMLEGAQLRNLDSGLITTFNENGEIYHQASYGNITNPNTGINHDFKIPMNNSISYREEERLREVEENLR